MDTCSERSFRSQKSSASYTGTVNSRRPLLSGHTSRDFSQSYYSDDEPQRRSFHRQRFQPHQVNRPPLPPIPGQVPANSGVGSGRGYVEMSPRGSHNDILKGHNSGVIGDNARYRFDKKKLTSMMANNKAQMANGGIQYTMYKSDSEFTDQSDGAMSPPPPLNQNPIASNRQQRHFTPTNAPIQNPSNNNPNISNMKPQFSNNNVQTMPMQSNMSSVNNMNMVPQPVQQPNLRMHAGLQGGVQSGMQQQHIMQMANNNNNNVVGVHDQNRYRVKSFPGVPEINMNANIHPNIAEHGDAWEKDTVITGASNKSSSLENLPEFPSRHHHHGSRKSNHNNPGTQGQNNMNMLEESDYGIYMDAYSIPFCQKWFRPTLALVLVAFVLVSSPSFALIPVFLWSEEVACGYSCFSTMMNLLFKSLILLVGCWAIFFRSSRATLPSVHIVRMFLMIFTVLFLVCHWGFYAVKVIAPRVADHSFILQFANSTIDCALFIYYLAVVCLEVMHLRTEYVIKVVRNTDGESRFYTVGHMSIQACASWILQQYYKDFSVFNPAAVTPMTSSKVKSNKHNSPQQYKFYDIDSFMPPTSAANTNTANALIDKSRAIIAASARKRDAGHNDRFYEEQDLERRVKKRRARLIVAAEEAFSHLKRVEEDENFQMGTKPPMNASESARAIFPSMARALQKYLKITSQQNRYTQEAIYDHLARCLTLDFTPKAFLEKYLNPGPVITSEVEQKPVQSWDLISECYINRGIKENVVFQLRQESISLIVYVARVPHIYIREGSFDSSQGTFVLRLDSETSV